MHPRSQGRSRPGSAMEPKQAQWPSARTCPPCRSGPGTLRHVVMACEALSPLVDMLRNDLNNPQCIGSFLCPIENPSLHRHARQQRHPAARERRWDLGYKGILPKSLDALVQSECELYASLWQSGDMQTELQPPLMRTLGPCGRPTGLNCGWATNCSSPPSRTAPSGMICLGKLADQLGLLPS